MAHNNTKKDAGMIVAAMKQPESVAPEMEQDHYDVAAQEVIDALTAKDPAALKEALKSFVSMCMDEPEAVDSSAEEIAE